MQPWVIIPAAGIGSRMNADRPKQFLPLHHSVVLQHTLNCFAPEQYAGIILVAPDSEALRQVRWAGTMIRVDGGKERADSVFNGLQHLHTITDDDAWVMVHDAARPCVPAESLERLQLDALASANGSILALPVAETVKKATSHPDNDSIDHTVSRDGLWAAQTPQMFRSGMLRQALLHGQATGANITDEASAMEAAGHSVRLTRGHPCNIKITRPDDLTLAGLYIQHLQVLHD